MESIIETKGGYYPVVLHRFATGTFVVVPTVVEEVDASIDSGAHDPDAQRFRHLLEANVPAPEPNR